MPYPCSRFYVDIKTDIRFDNRFDIRLWNSIHVKHIIDFVTKLGFMVWFNMDAIAKTDIKSDISFGISIKPTTYQKLVSRKNYALPSLANKKISFFLQGEICLKGVCST